MQEREKIIHAWFDMWLTGRDTGTEEIFMPDAVYIESWGPQYQGCAAIRHWFQEWNTRGKVIAWDIRQFFHKEDQTVVEWYFKNEMATGKIEEFDGLSLIHWTEDGKIQSLKEFGCNINRYDPYKNGEQPKFKDEEINWF